MDHAPLQLHRGGDDRPAIFTAADLASELDASPGAIVKHATADALGDCSLLGVKPDDLPPGLLRRLVGVRSMWRSMALAGCPASMALAAEYSRLLDDLDTWVMMREEFEEPLKPSKTGKQRR